MQMASTMANLGLSDWLPFASVTETEGIVLSVRAIVETTMKDTEITATTYWIVMVTNWGWCLFLQHQDSWTTHGKKTMLEEKEDFVSDVIDEEDAERVAAHQKE